MYVDDLHCVTEEWKPNTLIDLYLQVISSYNHPRISDLDHERHGETDGCYKNGYNIYRDRYGWKPGQLYLCTIPGGGKLKGL